MYWIIIDQHTFLASKNKGQRIEPELCTSDMGIVIKSISLEKKNTFLNKSGDTWVPEE